MTCVFCMLIHSSRQAHCGDVVGSVPDHHNKASIAGNQVTQIFWFPRAYKSHVYTIIY